MEERTESPSTGEDSDVEESTFLNTKDDTTRVIGGVYAPLLRLQKQREVDSASLIPLPPRVVGGLRDQCEKMKQCNCRRSYCLKLYCECFAGGIHCNSHCNCHSCRNDGAPDNYHHRNKAILSVIERNHDAFRPRVMQMTGAYTGENRKGGDALPTLASTKVRQIGCSCKRSRCLKKYCECYQATLYCSAECRCKDCQNIEGNAEREMLVADRRLREEASRSAVTQANNSKASGRMTPIDEAGRACYANDKPFQAKVGDAKATDTASASLMGAMAGCFDAFLPQSSFATPMKLRSGQAVAVLSFGNGATNGKPAAKLDCVNEAKTVASLQLSSVEKTKSASAGQSVTSSRIVEKTSSRPEGKSKRKRAAVNISNDGTSLEKSWKEETRNVRQVFDVIRSRLRGSGETKDHIDGTYREASNESSSQTFPFDVGSAIFEAVAHDLQNITKSIQETELLIKEKIEDRSAKICRIISDRKSNTDVALRQGNHDELEASLKCGDIQDDQNGSQLSDSAAQAMSIKAAQDAVLMREVARIIRSKAVQMSKDRVKNGANHI